MALPSNTTVTVDGTKLNAFTANVGLSSHHDLSGMPSMGSLTCALNFSADMHDKTNVPFATVKKLFDLANLPTREKIKDIKLEFWSDDARQDALCTIAFKGWISSWNITSGSGSNHILSISLQPALDEKNYHDLQLGN